MRRQQTVLSLGATATDSLVERFGTFTIIVLGEVVFGVVAGLVSAERDALTIVVALLALWIGFGFWWLRPAPWLLALLLVLLLGVVWAFAVLRFLSVDAWGDAPGEADGALPQRAAVGSSNAAENR